MSGFAILAAASGASGLLLGETLGLGPQKSAAVDDINPA